MSDAPSVTQADINPSQNGDDTSVVIGKPVAGDLAPKVPSQDAAPDDKPVAPEVKADEPVTPPKVEAVPSSAAEDGVVVYEPTGDAALDVSLAFMGKLGIEGTDPVMVAAANGDFSLLEAKLSTMGDEAKGWEKHLQLGKEAHGRQVAKFNDEKAATDKAVHAIVGGEANWKALVAWAGQNADPAEKTALNAMFDAGGFQAQAAARAILSAYQQAKGTTVNPANPASAASGGAPAAPQRLSAAEYHNKVTALFNQIGNAMDTSPEYAELRRQRFGR